MFYENGSLIIDQTAILQVQTNKYINVGPVHPLQVGSGSVRHLQQLKFRSLTRFWTLGVQQCLRRRCSSVCGGASACGTDNLPNGPDFHVKCVNLRRRGGEVERSFI